MIQFASIVENFVYILLRQIDMEVSFLLTSLSGIRVTMSSQNEL